MDTPSSLPTQTRTSNAPLLPRWLRVGVFVALILLVQGSLAFLLTWVDPPHTPYFVSIRVSEYESKSLFANARADSDLPFANSLHAGTTRQTIQQALDDLAKQSSNTPVVVHLSALAVQADAGNVFVLPSDASPDDRSTWLRLRDVLDKLQACRAPQKLLVLELMPAKLGYLYHDLATAIPRELDAVPDAARLVLSASSPGQMPHASPELGQSVFTHYFHEGLRGHADGYGDLRDGHIAVKELAAFVQARVERWSIRNRGDRQTPVLLGGGADFPLVSVDANAAHQPTPALAAREYPPWLHDAWKARDGAHQSGQFRLTPQLFQQQQAALLAAEHAWRFGNSSALECEAFSQRFLQATRKLNPNKLDPSGVPEAAKTFAESWRLLQSQVASAKPGDAESIKKRFIAEMRSKLPAAELDAVVFAHAVADPRLDPAALRLCDQLLHPAQQSLPRTAGALRIRQLADLAMRVEVLAWPRDLVETVLRCAELGEMSLRQTPYLPGYVDLLDEPALSRHAGEVRLWTRGYSSHDDARQRLNSAYEQFYRLSRLNEKWRACEQARDEALAELPWYVDALDALPELREPWQQAASRAKELADQLQTRPDQTLPRLARVERLTAQIEGAEKHAQALQKHRQALHAPFAKAAIARLERQCRSSHADASTLQSAETLLSVAAPVLQADDRAALWQAVQGLSLRLNGEALALDRQDNESRRVTSRADRVVPEREDEARRAERRGRWQLALLELAGIAELQPLQLDLDRCKQAVRDPQGWCELGTKLHELRSQATLRPLADEKSLREHERRAWVVFGHATDHGISPTVKDRIQQKDRQERWLQAHLRYLARDYQGLNLESPGTLAARAFYAQEAGAGAETYVRLNVAASVEPLTEKQMYSHVWLEVSRQVPAGAFGPVELQFHRADDVWLEVAPNSATLPALAESREPRTLTHKVPLKVTRKPKAERTGLPPPIGFLVEAKFEGRSYHHLVTVPLVPSTQALQILVSADSEEPATTLNEIRVRPGKVKQPHYVYLRNLTNRSQKVHVEIKAGEVLLHKSQKLLTLEPDEVRKVQYEESANQRAIPLRGAVTVRVLDADRQTTLAEKSLRVEILSPHEYVRTAEASYEPGPEANNRWAVQVQATKSVVGPAIAAQLVLPVQRIPGLMSVGGGTLRVELPTQLQSPRVLFAAGLKLVNPMETEGPVYLHIDGVARAFVYRTTFSRGGEPTQPTPDERPAVRLLAPPCVMAGINCLVDLEVDNAPRGSKLEVALGRTMDDDSFKGEIVREFTDAKKHGIDLETSKDALVFDASITDWTASFATRAITGPRELRARLIDANGKEIALARQALVIDETPPLAQIVPTPAQVKRGTVLQVQAQGVDPESGVSLVTFFFGRPDKGEIPFAAPRFRAVPANRELTQWSAALQVPPEHRGPLAVSVQVVNHAGMVSLDTVLLDVTDREPGKTGLGEIRGKVLEGPRPQPNLIVSLFDDRGNEIARTRTLPDGSYVFIGIAPGTYRVVCVKPDSQRRAVQNVIVEPDRAVRGDLALSL